MNDDMIRLSDVLDAINNIKVIPVAEDEGVWLLKQKARMCKFYNSCVYCPLFEPSGKISCIEWTIDHPTAAADIIRRWAAEHPEKLVKTKQDVLIELYPDAKIEDNGVLMLSPCNISKRFYKNNCDKYDSCDECRKSYWLAPADEEK